MLNNIARWFTDEWAIWRLTTEDDGWGNDIEIWEFEENIMGRFRPLSGDRKLSADKQTEFADAKFYCPIGTDILVGDELRKDGNRYEVLFVQDVMTMQEFLQIELKFKES